MGFNGKCAAAAVAAMPPSAESQAARRVLPGGARDPRAVCGDSPQTPDAREVVRGAQIWVLPSNAETRRGVFSPQRKAEKFLCASLFFLRASASKKHPATSHDATRCEAFPAGHRKQHASRVLHPGGTAATDGDGTSQPRSQPRSQQRTASSPGRRARRRRSSAAPHESPREPKPRPHFVKILVTGSRGFVGASFGVFAAAAGHEVLGISRSSQPEPGWPGRHVQGDAAQADLAPIIRDFNPDLLLQAAGSASVGPIPRLSPFYFLLSPLARTIVLR